MTKKPNSIDGFFISRRERSTVGAPRAGLDTLNQKKESGGLKLERRIAPMGQTQAKASVDDFFHQVEGNAPSPSGTAALPHPQPLPGEPGVKPKKRFRLHPPSRKTVKRIVLVLLLLVLIGAGYFAVRFFLASGQVFKGNVFNAIFAQGKELKVDENGRSNILIFGTSEDDPGHPGGHLTDSMIVASVDQKKNDAFMFSIPRDLYVDYGRACNSGYKGKINEVYQCAWEEASQNEDAGQAALRTKVGEVFGLDVQYSVHVNYTALKQAVDAVGGITVVIESNDPRGIYERYVKLPNGPAHLNGEAALALARARNAEGGYGLGSNFDREKNQQKILLALKEKAGSAGTLANPVALNGLINTLGENVRTNFDAEEVKTLAKLAGEVNSEAVRRLDLNDEKNPLVTTGNISGISIVRPVAGLADFSKIQATVQAYASGDTTFLENATVDVLNASGVPGAAQTRADQLADAGIAVEVVGNAPGGFNTAPVQLYDISDGQKPGTLKRLETVLGIKAIKQVPAGVTSASDFVIIVGSNGAS